MKNFDYLQDIEALRDLYGFCSAAEDTQQTNYDVCALNGRRALEWIVKAIYTLKGIELEKRTTLLELMSSEPFTQFVGDDDKPFVVILKDGMCNLYITCRHFVKHVSPISAGIRP